ncbi:hypothetical protein K431DRAFT_95317 [Polychaeton citri CBS 116435]|uniref:Uncharacterized protein n=1 Tax=Polychaeton citri CBS 116435 TaxID=1314669 RepID=A0A9P4ULN2_9PEZI|nr:hypothetical protein K431DRAFT_95317 [Polychaeton citri CBS 116435]
MCSLDRQRPLHRPATPHLSKRSWPSAPTVMQMQLAVAVGLRTARLLSPSRPGLSIFCLRTVRCALTTVAGWDGYSKKAGKCWVSLARPVHQQTSATIHCPRRSRTTDGSLKLLCRGVYLSLQFSSPFTATCNWVIPSQFLRLSILCRQATLQPLGRPPLRSPTRLPTCFRSLPYREAQRNGDLQNLDAGPRWV